MVMISPELVNELKGAIDIAEEVIKKFPSLKPSWCPEE